MASHEILGGKVLVYRRENSKRWQCSTRINGRNWRMSTGEDSLALAKEFAEDWFFRMKAKEKGGGLKDERSFKEAAKRFLEEYDVITGGTRNRFHVVGNERRLRLYLLPFFGELGLSEVTAGKVQEYRVMRYNSAPERVSPTSPDGKPEKKLPAKSTLHKEIVTLRQVLKTAIRHGWLAHLPDLSMPYKSAEKIAHRAWFSSEEYKRLYTATRNRVDRARKRTFSLAC
ncbi:hypothetical protein [Rhizobium pisi]|uniref:hypothetical protein n=1 Tax=Rhizobium TaxID=379 RepID=UPI003CFE316B